MKLKILASVEPLRIANTSDNEDSTIPQIKSINKIRCQGALSVHVNRPEFKSHRRQLKKNLTENNWRYDCIAYVSNEASYPMFNRLYFNKSRQIRGS